MLVDSHCHLNLLDSIKDGGSLDEVLLAAAQNSVEHMLCVGVDKDSWPGMMALVEGRRQVSASVGVHPNDPPGDEPDEAWLQAGAAHPQVVAIGETGLDYYRTDGDTGFQRERFRTHIRAARACGLPLIIHTRAARDDTLQVMREEGAEHVGGVMHCFTEDWEMAKAAIDMGFMISFSGIVTFKTAAALQDVARRVPERHLLVETDSPWLAPIPFRGKPNQPAWVRHVAEFVAELRGLSVEEVAETTTSNYDRVFGRWKD
ncbi:MAG: TatD family hydrolase [Xanthomonadaceae bacterium]|nr:TatD family hydrolase [Xanthomonadaceae bacterium]